MLLPGRYLIGRPGFWGWAGGMVFMVLFVVILALAVWAIVRFFDHGGRRHAGPPPYPGADPAVAQARFRYANGQLSREEYFQIVADLGFAPPGAPPPPWPPGPGVPAGAWPGGPAWAPPNGWV
jgi:uncharacterized membrane protein